MFALAALDEIPLTVNLKCDPGRAGELRETHGSHILPGYHMNKKHWNSLILDGYLKINLVFELTDHSYDLVVRGLSNKQKQELENLE